jgi:predicted MPP superfamily phosphohydrolase
MFLHRDRLSTHTLYQLHGHHPMSKRIALAMFSMILLIIVSVVGVNERSTLVVSTYSVHVEGLGSLRVVVLSDLHISTLNEVHFETLKQVERLRPDLLIFSGDAVESMASLSHLSQFLSLIPDTKAFATLGNWEHWGSVDIDKLTELYDRHGVQLLINDCVEVSIDSKVVQLIGLDDFTAGTPNLAAALDSCNSRYPAILVQHSPGYFDQSVLRPPNNVVINVAGHTHGGQINLFGTTLWTPEGSGRFIEGSYETKFGKLIVSRGIGTSLIPFRVGSKPEVVVLEFR